MLAVSAIEVETDDDPLHWLPLITERPAEGKAVPTRQDRAGLVLLALGNILNILVSDGRSAVIN